MGLLRLGALLLTLLSCLALLADTEARAQKTKPGAKADKDKDKAGFADLGDNHAEVTLLRVLHSLEPTPRQLDILKAFATKYETMQKPPPRKLLKVSDKYRKALTALRDALLSGNDERIEETGSALDDIREKEDPEFDDTEISDTSRKYAPDVLRAFTARQVALYIGGLEDFPDPFELLRDGLNESQKTRGTAWTNYRDDTAYKIGWLVAGLDATKEEKVRKAATDLLNKGAKLDEAEFAKSRPALIRSIAEVVGKIGPTDVIRNFMERLLAETLSNHRLIAIVAQLKKRIPKEPAPETKDKPKEKEKKSE